MIKYDNEQASVVYVIMVEPGHFSMAIVYM